jgi:hypothetical protein
MAHARRYHRHYRTSGHVWQGRFKAFPIQDDDHLRTVGLPDTRRLPRAGLPDTHRLARGILIAANHSEWGCLEPPFVRRGEGEVKVGARLHVTIQPSARKGMSFRPTVLVADPERELRWLGRFLLPGLFDGEHSFGEMRSSWSQCHEPHVARAAAAWVCRRHTEVSLRELSQWPGVRSKPPAYSERMNPSAVTTILAAFTRKRDRRRGRDGLLRSSISTVLFSSAATAERWLAFRRR